MDEKVYAYATRNSEGEYVIIQESCKKIITSPNRINAAKKITDYVLPGADKGCFLEGIVIDLSPLVSSGIISRERLVVLD